MRRVVAREVAVAVAAVVVGKDYDMQVEATQLSVRGKANVAQ